MKQVRRVLIAAILVGGGVYFVLPAILPNGVWRRRVVRENPLKNPIRITSIRGDTLLSDRQEFRLAGVMLPTETIFAARATDFLNLATAQGVEVIRRVQPEGTFILRCEPRIWHWCGNDPVKEHYEQFNLNELLVAFGYAIVDPAANDLSENERNRLKAAEVLAKEQHRGMWVERPGTNERSFRPEFGLNISDASNLRNTIDYKAEEIAEQR